MNRLLITPIIFTILLVSSCRSHSVTSPHDEESQQSHDSAITQDGRLSMTLTNESLIYSLDKGEIQRCSQVSERGPQVNSQGVQQMVRLFSCDNGNFFAMNIFKSDYPTQVHVFDSSQKRIYTNIISEAY
jgi:hypothetical protein